LLVIVPNLDSVKNLSDALRSAGYQIQVIQERDVRLAAFSPDPCVAIVVIPATGDPHSQTDDVCSALERQRPTLPIMVLGPDVLAVKLRLFALGVDDYVVDSLDRLELLARIRSLIRKRRLSSSDSACR